MKKTVFLTLLFVALMAFSPASAQDKSQAQMDEFISELMAKMTLEEKLGQLNLLPAGGIVTGGAMDTEVGHLIKEGKLGSIFNIKGSGAIRELQQIAVEKSRLKIPLLVGMDVIHGYETIFPIPLALSCSWDLPAIERSARIAALEASSAGINWTYSPMVDIALDARWGRISEGAGEDPYLGSLIAKAMVEGYQGDYSKPYNILACVKHYALYGAVEAGLDYNTVDMSHLRMYNQYFPPYKAAAQAGAASFMSSFNIVDGQHATANKWLLTDVLRDQWKFNGFVVTDYASIAEMRNHGFGDLTHSSALALNAGTDMDMCSYGFIGTLKESLENGNVTQQRIDEACRKILEAKYKLGLFKDPYKFLNAKREEKVMYSNDNRKAARDIAAETFVLLKNENNVLPLKKQGKIALIGPLANTRSNLVGTWTVAFAPDKYKTLKEGFETALKGKAELLYAQGCNIEYDETLQRAIEAADKRIERVDDVKAREEALSVARQADVIVCAMGECAEYSGESAARTNLELPQCQMDLLKELVKLGKPVVMLNFAGRPTVLSWESENVDALMNVWFGGSETPDAICDVLFGDKAPCGRLTTSLPKVTGQEPLYYSHLNTGRPSPENEYFSRYRANYTDIKMGPLYPFGYGLSYTTFKYGELNVTGSGRHFEATVTVTNTGKYDAYEVVQLYVHDVFAAVTRPVKELKGFERVFLKAGETKTVTIPVNEEALTYYDMNGNIVFEPGEFEIMVGPNSRELQVKKVTAM